MELTDNLSAPWYSVLSPELKGCQPSERFRGWVVPRGWLDAARTSEGAASLAIWPAGILDLSEEHAFYHVWTYSGIEIQISPYSVRGVSQGHDLN
jgi:hypothetical protein